MKSMLIIYAYSSFISAWGPGPKLIENFKKQCNCEIKMVDMGDTNLVIDRLSRMKTEKQVDVVVGLDSVTLRNATKKLSWTNLKGIQPKGYVGSGSYAEFVALDWAPLSFVYRNTILKNPPKQIDDLLDARFKNQILLEDPRLSTPGLQFLAWVHFLKKNKTKEFLEKLKPQIHSISPSWSTAYGLFKKEQAQLVFSYLSSPIYHWTEDKDETYQSIKFKEKHPIQVEWVGVPKNCGSCKLAEDFVKFLLTDESQKLIMDLNYMFPVNKNLIKTTLYEKLPAVETVALKEYKNLDVEALLNTWKSVFR